MFCFRFIVNKLTNFDAKVSIFFVNLITEGILASLFSNLYKV